MVTPEFSENPPSESKSLIQPIPIIEIHRGQFKVAEPALTPYKLQDPLLSCIELMAEIKSVFGVELGISDDKISFTPIFTRDLTDESRSDYKKTEVAQREFVKAMEEKYGQGVYLAGYWLVDKFDDMVLVGKTRSKKPSGFELLSEALYGHIKRGLRIKFID